MDYPRRIMVVGGGGRECALANALLLSPEVEALAITPANWGVVDHRGGRVVQFAVKPTDLTAVVQAARDFQAGLVVIGPEDPLCAGLADELRAAGIPTVGPGQAAARLEGSKHFAKQFMQRHGLPTAAYAAFDDPAVLLAYCERLDRPVVLKADGLAAGKGVIVCQEPHEAQAAARRIAVDREFGRSGDLVLVEELLRGVEISWTCLVSGGRVHLLVPSTDYKRLRDGDQGPNTGGMGNIAPTPFATPEVVAEFHRRIREPLEAGLRAEGMDYRGFLFVGTMLTTTGLQVLEFNVRLGDPEAEVVLPLYDCDWGALLAQVVVDAPVEVPAPRAGAACVAVMAASAGYPTAKSAPTPIAGLDRPYARGLLTPGVGAEGRHTHPPVSVYFAGVGREVPGGAAPPAGHRNYYDCLDQVRFTATGGRVLAVSALGQGLSEARRVAYETLGNLRFDGMQYRTDIGGLE